jgi:nitroreductase
LSASGFGLMPYQIFIVEDADLKAKIQPIAYGQPQIAESSHLLIFAAWNEVNEAQVDEYMNLIAETRGMSLSDLGDFKGAIMGSMGHRTKEQQAQWADRQVYLAMGTALAAAAELQIDTTPMEGFMPAKLELNPGVYTPCGVMPVLPDQTPPGGVAKSTTLPALVHVGEIGAINGVWGLNTFTNKVLLAGHTLAKGVEGL